MTEKTAKTDLATKIEKVWKVSAAVVGLFGMLSTAASWGFSYAMSDRDRRVEELTAEITSLNQNITTLQGDLRTAELRINNDMQDVQIALSAIQIYLNRRAEVEASIGGTSSHIRSRPMPSEHALLIDPDLNAASPDETENEASAVPPDELLRNALERLSERRAL